MLIVRQQHNVRCPSCSGDLSFQVDQRAYALVAIGLISFAAVAQFAPVIIGGLLWRGGTRQGALAGLGSGFAVSICTLLLPSLPKSDWLPANFLDSSPFGLALLKPQELFGLQHFNEITRCLFLDPRRQHRILHHSICCNHTVTVEVTQATVFVDALKQTRPIVAGLWRGKARFDDLIDLVSRFSVHERARSEFATYTRGRGLAAGEDLPPMRRRSLPRPSSPGPSGVLRHG